MTVCWHLTFRCLCLALPCLSGRTKLPPRDNKNGLKKFTVLGLAHPLVRTECRKGGLIVHYAHALRCLLPTNLVYLPEHTNSRRGKVGLVWNYRVFDIYICFNLVKKPFFVREF